MATFESVHVEGSGQLTFDDGPVLKTGFLYKQGTVSCHLIS